VKVNFFSPGSLLSTELSIRVSNIHSSDFTLYRFYCLPDKQRRQYHQYKISCYILQCLYSFYVAVYMITQGGTGNLTCTIKPRWLNVNVTYVRDGYITLDPSAQLLPDIPLNASMIIQSVTQVIRFHFLESQTVYENAIQNILTQLGAEMLNVNASTASAQVTKFQTNIIVSTHYTIGYQSLTARII
jgi:hypothetical protein